MAVVELPCPKLPKLDVDLPNIKLFGGAELKGFADFSLGLPTNCTVNFNLLIQLAPLLASMTCLLHILGVIQALQKFAQSPLTEAADLLEAIGKVAECFVALTPVGIAVTIKGILSVILNFLSCLLSELDSILKVQVSIDLNSAQGNPVLLASLECARDNAEVSLQGLLQSIGPLQPLLGMTTNIGAVAGLELGLPDLSNLSAVQDVSQVVADLKSAVTTIQTVIDGLPL